MHVPVNIFVIFNEELARGRPRVTTEEVRVQRGRWREIRLCRVELVQERCVQEQSTRSLILSQWNRFIERVRHHRIWAL